MNCCKKHLPEKPIIMSADVFGPSITKREFTTGSSYEGDLTPGKGMHGFGVYTFPNGVVYKGEFRDNVMHGKGELTYQTYSGKAIIRGEWKEGILTERTFLFDDDTLEYEKDWQYCKMPDRRYSKEYADGLQPGGRSILTAYQPPKTISEGCYDTGDGLYDPKKNVIYDYDDFTRIIRRPSVPEKKWIIQNCRMGNKTMTMGPRLDFYEKYVEPTVLLEPNLPPAAKYRDKSAIDEDSNVDFWPDDSIVLYKKDHDSKKYGEPISTDSRAELVLNK